MELTFVVSAGALSAPNCTVVDGSSPPRVQREVALACSLDVARYKARLQGGERSSDGQIIPDRPPALSCISTTHAVYYDPAARNRTLYINDPAASSQIGSSYNPPAGGAMVASFAIKSPSAQISLTNAAEHFAPSTHFVLHLAAQLKESAFTRGLSGNTSGLSRRTVWLNPQRLRTARWTGTILLAHVSNFEHAEAAAAARGHAISHFMLMAENSLLLHKGVERYVAARHYSYTPAFPEASVACLGRACPDTAQSAQACLTTGLLGSASRQRPSASAGLPGGAAVRSSHEGSFYPAALFRAFVHALSPAARVLLADVSVRCLAEEEMLPRYLACSGRTACSAPFVLRYHPGGDRYTSPVDARIPCTVVRALLRRHPGAASPAAMPPFGLKVPGWSASQLRRHVDRCRTTGFVGRVSLGTRRSPPRCRLGRLCKPRRGG